MVVKTARNRLPAMGRSMKPTRPPAARPLAVRPVVTRPSPPPKQKTSDTITLFIHDVVSSMERVTTQPAVMMTGIVAVVLILSHLGSADDSILDSWVNYVNTTQPKLGEWLHDRESWLYGIAAFTPAVLSVPERSRVMVTIASAAWILVLPHRHPWEYLIQAAAVRVFFTTGRASTRSILVIMVALLYWLGLMTFSD